MAARPPSKKRPAKKSDVTKRPDWDERADGLGGASISLDALGRASVVPVAVERLNPHLRALTGRLMLTVGQRRQLDLDIVEDVRDLRGHGVSWGVIGYALGVTSEAARQRYAESSEV